MKKTVRPPQRFPLEKPATMPMHKPATRAVIRLSVILLSFWLMVSFPAWAQKRPAGEKDPINKREGTTLETPDLADIIPLASALRIRLAILKTRVAGFQDVSMADRRYVEFKEILREHENRIKKLMGDKDFRYSRVVQYRQAITLDNRLFEEINAPLSISIQQLGGWRKEWLEERRRWGHWHSSLKADAVIAQLASVFEEADQVIDTALELVRSELSAKLRIQAQAADLYVRMNALTAELDGLISDGRLDALLEASPPMISHAYILQFDRELWYALPKGIEAIAWPPLRFYTRGGWIILLQSFLTVSLIAAFYRHRSSLKGSKQWRFIAARPVSAGYFFCYMATVLIYEYYGSPASWGYISLVVAGFTFARLVGGLTESSWKRQIVYGLIVVILLTRLLEEINLPLPLLRLYLLFSAAALLVVCLRWAAACRRLNETALYIWLLRLGALFSCAVMIAELWGNAELALYLFMAVTLSITTVMVFLLSLHMIHGGLEWLFRVSPLKRTAVLYSEPTEDIIASIWRFISVTTCVLVLLPAILMHWGVYDNLVGAINGLLALGLNLGTHRITMRLLIVSAGVVYGAILLSWIAQKVLMDEALLRRRIKKGVRRSVARFVHYFILSIGFIVAISILGFEVTELTLMISALGVGIGFGLQGIVNNFISGLVLLFEQPVRVGDVIELNGVWSEITNVGLRATTVKTYDYADVIIPNAVLVNNQLTNWTLSDRMVRLIIPVGVAYGSDVPLVMQKMIESAHDNPKVAQQPAPQVLFTGFGESSLDFQLRVWITDADHIFTAKSDIHQALDNLFRKAGIKISFPQHDLHLKDVVPLEISERRQPPPKAEKPEGEEVDVSH